MNARGWIAVVDIQADTGFSVNSKLKAYPYDDGFEIVGNREGLRKLARVCLALADLPEDDEQAKRLLQSQHHAGLTGAQGGNP
jgi:hypothetical protein